MHGEKRRSTARLEAAPFQGKSECRPVAAIFEGTASLSVPTAHGDILGRALAGCRHRGGPPGDSQRQRMSLLPWGKGQRASRSLRLRSCLQRLSCGARCGWENFDHADSAERKDLLLLPRKGCYGPSAVY